MNKEDVYIYTMKNYSAIKRNRTVPFAETYMDLETVVQSEVNQKEKKYHILMHIFGIQKNGADEPVSKEGIESQSQRMDM